MENNRPPQDAAVCKAMDMAQTPAGQALIALLQKSGGQAMEAAMSRAAAGDYTQVRALLSTIMADPEANRLFREMGGSDG